MFNKLYVLRIKLDKFYQYTDDMSWWKKQLKLHHDYYNLQTELVNLLYQAKLDYHKHMCS